MLKELNTLLEKIPVWKELVGLPKRVQELEQKVKDLLLRARSARTLSADCLGNPPQFLGPGEWFCRRGVAGKTQTGNLKGRAAKTAR